MIDKITLIGEYLLDDVTLIGGKEFTKNRIQETHVTEETFQKLLLAVENKWFSIKSHNYNEYLIQRGRPHEVTGRPEAISRAFTIAEVMAGIDPMELPVGFPGTEPTPEPELAPVIETETIKDILYEVTDALVEANPELDLKPELENAVNEVVEAITPVKRRR